MSMSCPEGMLISIQFAQYGRQVPSSEMCPHGIQGDDPSTWNSRSYAARQVALWEDTNCLATTSLTVGLIILMMGSVFLRPSININICCGYSKQPSQ